MLTPEKVLGREGGAFCWGDYGFRLSGVELCLVPRDLNLTPASVYQAKGCRLP